MLRFVKPNFVGGSVVVSEPVRIPKHVIDSMPISWKMRRFFRVLFFGDSPIEYYDRQLRFTPKELGKEFAFYDEQMILEKYATWFEIVSNEENRNF